MRCHGKETELAGGLDLRTLEAVKKGGKSGPAVEPGDPAKSLLFKAHKNLTKIDEDEPWPNAAQIDTMGRWVKEGATSTADRKVSIWWEVLAFITLTLAEVLISITGLELAFVVAPPSMKSFVTALWLMTVAIANFFINAPVGRLYSTMSPGNYHLMLTGLMVVVIVVFFFVAQRFNQMAKEQEDAQKAAAAPVEGDPAGDTPASPQQGA